MSRPITKNDKLDALNTYANTWKMHMAELDADYAPPENSFLHKLWRARKLTQRQCIAANLIYEYTMVAAGCSHGLVGGYQERVDTPSRRAGGYDHKAFENAAQQHLRGLYDYLHPHQRPYIVTVIQDYHQTNKNHVDISVLGAVIAGYNNKPQAQAAGTAVIQSFLNSAADFFGI